MVNFFATPLNSLINNVYFIPELFLYCVCVVLKTIVIASFYIIAMNNDSEDIKNELLLYITDFSAASFNAVMSGLTFVILTLFSCLGIVAPIFFVNYCIFFLVFATVRKNEKGDRFSAVASISESFKLTKTFRLKLFLINTIVIFGSLFIVYMMPTEIYIDTFNISYLLKILITDLVIIYLIKTCFEMEKIRNKKLEEIRQKEVQDKYNAMRARSTV